STTLTADNIVTGYGKQEIVHGVSLSAEAGKITCIFGPNGSGKSTLLKAIVGALPVWSGTASLGESTLSNLAVHEVVRQGLVLMPQGGGVFPRLTVMENLRMGGYAIADRRIVEQRIEALIEQY
ncbi:MAG: ATP-binding cassette domain-containing protein, partial [Mesorhizobium sp.]